MGLSWILAWLSDPWSGKSFWWIMFLSKAVNCLYLYLDDPYLRHLFHKLTNIPQLFFSKYTPLCAAANADGVFLSRFQLLFIRTRICRKKSTLDTHTAKNNLSVLFLFNIVVGFALSAERNRTITLPACSLNWMPGVGRLATGAGG